MNILKPKIWFFGLYHLAVEVKIYSTNKLTETRLHRLCERDLRYEGEQDAYWPIVTCLACPALERVPLLFVESFMSLEGK